MSAHLDRRYDFKAGNFSLKGYWWTDKENAHWFICEGRMTFGVAANGDEISITDGVRFSEPVALGDTQQIFDLAKAHVRKSILAQRQSMTDVMRDVVRRAVLGELD